MRPAPRESTPAPARLPAAVVHVVTVPVSLDTQLGGQLSYMRGRGYDVHVITSPGPELAAFAEREGVPAEAIPMRRAITPMKDLVALYRLWRSLRRIRPQIVHSHTPKGGLLGMIAATLARTPVRIYHLRGLPFVTATGLRRRLLRSTEWVSCALAHRVIAISHSTQSTAVEEGLSRPDKIGVLLGGGNGVDAAVRFKPQPASVRSEIRGQLQIPEDALVIGFVGRLARDKGIVELAAAWKQLRERDPRLHLLLVGWNELEPGLAEMGAALQADPRVRLTGPRSDVPRLYAAMDVVALPTYREGFPNVAVEAAAMALPLVATSIPGCVDAVQDGVTGTLVPVADAGALRVALERYIADPALRSRHGQAGRRRVLQDFRREAIWEAIDAEYQRLLEARRPVRRFDVG